MNFPLLAMRHMLPGEEQEYWAAEGSHYRCARCNELFLDKDLVVSRGEAVCLACKQVDDSLDV